MSLIILKTLHLNDDYLKQLFSSCSIILDRKYNESLILRGQLFFCCHLPSVRSIKLIKIKDTEGTPMRERLKPATAAVLLSSLLFSLTPMSANAACKGMNCACKPSELNFASPALKPNADGQYPLSLEADNVQSQGEDLVELIGNAEVQQGRQTIVADNLKYYRLSERVVATGNVEMISENGDYLASDSIDVFAPTQIGTLGKTDFKLSKGLTSADGVDTATIESRGSAETVNLEGEGVVRLENAKYTTCPEGNDSVVIGAREIELDRIGGIGRARGATIRFKGVPIFYMPYVSFPLNDQRKTGFLAPGYGSDEESGNIIEVPWYWNIAKNQDATITSRYYTERGLQVGAEYRHRSVNSSTYIYGEILPDDELFAQGLDEDDSSSSQRDLLSIQHTQQFTPSLSGRINYNDVSDIDYFTDLRNEVRYFSARYVPRDVQLNYSHDYFNVNVRANEYQIIDESITNAPYERLPSVSFSTNLPDGPFDLEYGVNASYTSFSSDDDNGDGVSDRLEGDRLAVTPYAQIPFENIWGYVKPRVSLHYRSYSLDRPEGSELDSDPSFSVPIFSVDSGIYFERNTSWFGDNALQTLEPRLYYVYAPEEDQDEVPVFDTSQISLNNFSNIFRENRFFGEDRVGDTNQATIGLTSRVIDSESGDERLKFSIGQLILLDDLNQNIRSSATIEQGLGDLLVELKTRSMKTKGSWSTYSFVQYSHEEEEALRTAKFDISYQPKGDARKNVSVGYYFRELGDDDLEQLTYNANWPLADRWQLFGSGRYSLERSENIASSIGIEYNGCCWKIRLVGTERVDSRLLRNSDPDDDEPRQSVFLEFELTSLGRLRTGIR